MTSDDSNLADLVAEQATSCTTVRERIERRLEVLREWHREGVPAGKHFPRSLTDARLWVDTELNIIPIASPNEFTTTHHLHGRLVQDVAGLITELKKRFDRPSKTRLKKSSAAVAKYDTKAFKQQLEAAVSQWHTERDLRLSEKRRVDSAEARSLLLLEENSQKDELIADLHRKLAAHQGLKGVK